jgi:hypothetical protein
MADDESLSLAYGSTRNRGARRPILAAEPTSRDFLMRDHEDFSPVVAGRSDAMSAHSVGAGRPGADRTAAAAVG